MGCGASSEKEGTAAPGPFHKSWSERQGPIVLGHRGGSLRFPENTLEAFADAMAVGADGAELDVMLSSDGKIVVFHDENTSRVTGASHVVGETPWATLQTLRTLPSLTYDVATLTYESTYAIPLLEAVLAHFHWPDGPAYKDKKENTRPFLFNIELKPSTPLTSLALGTKVAELIRDLKMQDQVVVTSFDFAKLRCVERAVPKIHSGWGYDDDMTKYLSADPANRWYDDDEETKSSVAVRHPTTNSAAFVQWLVEAAVVDRIIGATVVAIEHTLLDNDTVRKFQKKGFAVGAYTLYPYDQAAVHRKVDNVEQLHRESENVLRQLMKQKINWVETDDAAETVRAVTRIKKEG